MRKPLMVVAAAALSVASLAGCKLEVEPVVDTPAAAKTTIDGDGLTVFSDTKTALGVYKSAGSTTDGDLAADACEWELLGQLDSDAPLEVIDSGDTVVVDEDPGADVDLNNEDEVQTFTLAASGLRFEANNCKDFVKQD